MLRCTDKNPCPVCGRGTNEGCLYAEGGTAAICVRTPGGAVKKAGQAGWLHIIKEGFKPKPVTVKQQIITLNWGLLNDAYMETLNHFYTDRLNIGHSVVDELCERWGVCALSLKKLQIGYNGKCFTFPLRNAENKPVGLQRLYPDNSKRLVKHSKAGIFIPRLNWNNLETLYICEGLSDTATALDMELKAIGRLSCNTGKENIIKFCVKKLPQKVVIVADNDEPGIAGAKALGLWLAQGYCLFTVPKPHIKMIIPGASDLRQWVKEKGKDFVKKILTS